MDGEARVLLKSFIASFEPCRRARCRGVGPLHHSPGASRRVLSAVSGASRGHCSSVPRVTVYGDQGGRELDVLNADRMSRDVV